MPAFQKAIEHGAKGLELDVQLTKDNRLIICHDHKLTRFNKQAKKLIKDMTLAEIKQIDVGASFSEEYRGTTLITLEELLQICPKELCLNIEIKNIPVIYEGIEEVLINCLQQENRLENIVISSFDHVALQKIQQLAPDIELGMLFYYRMLKPWEYAKQCGLRITNIHPNYVYTDKNFIDNCHKQGLNVFPFTVNDTKRYETLLDYGVDGVFSNNPLLFGTIDAQPQK